MVPRTIYSNESLQLAIKVNPKLQPHSNTIAMQVWKEYQQEHKDRFLNELLDLLRIPSVSARGEHKEDMIR